MQVYRRGQGNWARGIGAGCLWAVALFGSIELGGVASFLGESNEANMTLFI